MNAGKNPASLLWGFHVYSNLKATRKHMFTQIKKINKVIRIEYLLLSTAFGIFISVFVFDTLAWESMGFVVLTGLLIFCIHLLILIILSRLDFDRYKQIFHSEWKRIIVLSVFLIAFMGVLNSIVGYVRPPQVYAEHNLRVCIKKGSTISSEDIPFKIYLRQGDGSRVPEQRIVFENAGESRCASYEDTFRGGLYLDIYSEKDLDLDIFWDQMKTEVTINDIQSDLSIYLAGTKGRTTFEQAGLYYLAWIALVVTWITCSFLAAVFFVVWDASFSRNFLIILRFCVFLFALFMLLELILLANMATHVSLASDDFGRMDRSLSSISVFISNTIEHYQVKGTSRFTNKVYQFFHVIFPNFYPYSIILDLSIWVFGLYLLVSEIIQLLYRKKDRFLAVLLAIIIPAWTLSRTPYVFQSFFWKTGHLAGYIYPEILFPFWMTFFLRLRNKQDSNKILFTISGLLSGLYFAFHHESFNTGLIFFWTGTLLFILLLDLTIPAKKILTSFSIAALIGCLIAMIVMLSAPGLENYAQIKGGKGVDLMSIFLSFSDLTRDSINGLFDILVFSNKDVFELIRIIIFFVVILIIGFMYSESEEIRFEKNRSTLVLWMPFVLLGMLFAMQLPGEYIVGRNPKRFYLLAISFFQYFIVFFGLTLAVGFNKKFLVYRSSRVFVSIVSTIAIIWLGSQSLTTHLAYTGFREDFIIYKATIQQIEKDAELALRNGKGSITINYYYENPYFVQDPPKIGEDTNWINSGMKKYFGVDVLIEP
jgi:hypothetical protein